MSSGVAIVHHLNEVGVVFLTIWRVLVYSMMSRGGPSTLYRGFIGSGRCGCSSLFHN
jgi:hypothetical protein